MSHILNIRLDDRQKGALEDLSRRRGNAPLSTLARELLVTAIEREADPARGARELLAVVEGDVELRLRLRRVVLSETSIVFHDPGEG